MKARPIKVLIAKPGLDGHDRGVKVVALALRDAGMEVIYIGMHRTVDEIVRTAMQEDVDVIGLSMLSGSHLPISQRLMKRIKVEKMTDVLVVIGGNIHKKDWDKMKSFGVDGIFPTDSSFEEIVNFIESHVRRRSGGTDENYRN